MKKMTKLTKIFLVLVTIFSQLSGVVKVLAEEIILKPLTLSLQQNINESDNSVQSYTLSYKSERASDYEETLEDGTDKIYTLELTSIFSYLDNTKSDPVIAFTEVSGKTLNNERNTYDLDAISHYYNGEYSLTVKVYDGEEKLYEKNLTFDVNNNLKGLKGYLNDYITPEKDSEYNVEEAQEYTQYLSLNVGELSPNSSYKVICNGKSESEVMTGEELRNYTIQGNSIDLTNKFAGEYNLASTVKVIEVVDGEDKNTYDYEYDAIINYGTSEDNDEILNDIYYCENLWFYDGYAVSYANGVITKLVGDSYEESGVPTIGDIVEALDFSGIPMTVEDTSDDTITVTIFDENGIELDLTDEEVLTTEIKNGYTLKFECGTAEEYKVVIAFDVDGDNVFTTKDIELTMKGLINGDTMPSVDLVGDYDEEIGTITFDDVMYLNEFSKEEPDLDAFPEDNSEDFKLILSEIPSEIYVGDTFEVDVLLNKNHEEVNDYIDGLYGEVQTLGNLELTEVKVSSEYTSYSENGKFVLAGPAIEENQSIVVTLKFTALSEGTDKITLNGKTAKFLNINDFDEIVSDEVVIARKVSTNNDLLSLTPSVGKLDKEFDRDVTVYTLTVPYDTKTVVLSGELADLYATCDGLVEYELTEEKTVALINVTAEDGSIKTYTVYIVKEDKPAVETITYKYSTNNYLKVLEVEGYEIEFNKETNEYNIKVNSTVTSLDIKAIAEDAKARVEITGNENFKTGKNTVTVKVTAEDGSTREYKLLVEKEEAKKLTSTEEETKKSSNTGEKVVIIILIIAVVAGLLYLIFKRDEEVTPVTKEKSSNNQKHSHKK